MATTMAKKGPFTIPASASVLNSKTVEKWSKATWSVKDAQEKFVEAYRATLDDQMPGWQDNWKTDAAFDKNLTAVEKIMREICIANNMTAHSFNYYKHAARRILFCGLSWKLGNQNYTKEQCVTLIQTPEERREEVAKEMRRHKTHKRALSKIKADKAVITRPRDGMTAEQHAQWQIEVCGQLREYLELTQSVIGGGNAFAEFLSKIDGVTAGFRPKGKSRKAG